MEGGAMRGLFTCGVIDVFMENGIEFDGAIGVSAGAAFGCNYKSKQIGRGVRYNKKYCGDKRYSSISNLLRTGDLFDPEFCYHTLPYELDVLDVETFVNNPMEFYVVATDAVTGEPAYYKLTDGGEVDVEWIRASASMPIVSNVVKIGDRELMDGGVADSVPIKYFESIGYNRNVIILTQPLGYFKRPNKMVPLAKRKHREYPKLVEALKNRHVVYNRTTRYILDKEHKGEVLVIRPPKDLDISRTCKDPEELERVYQIGRKVAMKKLEEVKKFLS